MTNLVFRPFFFLLRTHIYILNSFQSNEAEILQYCSCSTAVFVIFGWTVLTTTDAGVCVYSILQLCCFKPRPLFVFLQLRCEQDVNQSVSEMMLYWFGAELSDGEAPRLCVLLYASVLTFVCGFGGFFFIFYGLFVCLFVLWIFSSSWRQLSSNWTWSSKWGEKSCLSPAVKLRSSLWFVKSRVQSPVTNRGFTVAPWLKVKVALTSAFNPLLDFRMK